MHQRAPLLAALAVLLLSTPAAAQVSARLFRQPDVSETRITFVYGNDVWVVAKEGGTAHRLTSPEDPELFPRFSPDGRTIAFSGNYDGNLDVYTIPAGGGLPTRVTHHPEADRMVDWYPDGEGLFYASEMASGRERYSQFWRTSPDGGMPERLPVAYGEMGAVSPDGGTLAFTPESRLFRTWKRYRGGAAADIWLFDLEEGTAERVTDHVANDEMPMWAGGTLYFLSDRGPNKRYNLWAHDLATGEKRQVTEFTDGDVHFPAVGPSDVVFEARHRYHGVLAPNSPLRSAVVASAGEAATFPQTTPPRPVSTLSRRRAHSHSRRVSSRWAALVARIHHARPLVCPECGESMRLIAFLTDPFSIRDVLSHLGEPVRSPAVHPARGPPELEFGFTGPSADGMDQTPAVDPAEPEPIPPYEMDQTRSW